jgi:hypothetical protein
MKKSVLFQDVHDVSISMLYEITPFSLRDAIFSFV